MTTSTRRLSSLGEPTGTLQATHNNSAQVMTEWREAAAVAAGRAQRIQTVATTQAQVASRHAESQRKSERRIATWGAFAGFAGLCGEVASLLPDFMPYDLVFTVSVASLLLLAVPLAMLIRSANRTGSSPEVLSSASSAKANSIAVFGSRIGQVIADIQEPDGLTLVQRGCFDALLADAEADIARIRKAARSGLGTSADARRHERLVPRYRKVVLRTADGRQLRGTIADLSLSGVALSESLPRIAAGHEVTVGRHPAIVVRTWDKGVALKFKTFLDASTFDEDIVL